MSHWFKVKTRLMSETAIKKAANSIGYSVRHRQECRGYNDHTTNCDLVMKLPGEYDVGFQKQSDGSYEMVADFWSDHISKYLADPNATKKAEISAEKLNADGKYAEAEDVSNAAKVSKFTQAYNMYAVNELAQAQGLQYIENRLEDGSIVLELTGEGF